MAVTSSQRRNSHSDLKPCGSNVGSVPKTTYPSGHEYHDTKVSGQGRVHMGDVYNHYNGIPEDTKCQKFLQSLRLTDPQDDLEDIRRARGEVVKGTCRWLLVEDEYVSWEVGDKPQLLRLQGGPGMGKTMISGFLVNELEERARQDSAVTLAYYFCDNKVEGRRTASVILRGLLLQLLRQRPILFKHVQKDYDEMKGRLPELFENLDTLWRIFRSILKDHDASKVYILVDALDECERSSRQGFLTRLKKLFTEQRSDENMDIKFLITCRPDLEIEDSLGSIGRCLRIDPVMINTDLSKFIDVKVDELSRCKGYPVALKHDIKVALTNQALGTFLWASLVLQDISKTKITSKVRGKLQTLPSSLGEVYDRILNNIDDEYREDAILILQWVVIARRPLTVRELAMARALDLGNWKENTLPSADVLEELLDGYRCCEPLLYRDSKTDTINLVHQSAKDYLLGEYLQRNRELSRYHIVAEKANFLLFESCWRYLSLEEFHRGSMIIKRNEKEVLCPVFLSKECLESYDFLQYAAENWQEHALACSQVLKTDYEWNRDYLERSPTLRDTWLYRAAEYGDEEVVRLLLENGADVDVNTWSTWVGGTPLLTSAWNGHEAVARLLLGNGANVAAEDGGGWTALHLAAWKGHEAVAQLLLENGADVAAESGDGWTALHQAADKGHEAIVRQLLLQKGTNLNAKNEHGLTGLLLAARRGHDAIIELLVRNNVDVNAKGGMVIGGREADMANGLLRSLLDNVADVDKKGDFRDAVASEDGELERLMYQLAEKEAETAETEDYGRTALVLMAERGNEAMVRLLIEKGADIEETGDHRGTALVFAAARGHEATVQLLVDEGAEIEKIDDDCCTVLLRAAEGGHEATVRLLVNEGAEIDAMDYNCCTALLRAAAGGHKATVQLLIDEGAEIEAVDDDNRTALLAAAEEGHRETVELLLDKGADIEAIDGCGRTALGAAARKGHKEIVQVLIKRGASIEAKGNNGTTALISAAQRGHEEIVQLLIKRGASIEAKGSNGTTALISAAEEGHEEIVRLLLDNDADIEANDEDGRTALVHAAAGEHDGILRALDEIGEKLKYKRLLIPTERRSATVQLLVERGANMEKKDRNGRTALMRAAEKAYETTVRVLAENGANLEEKGEYGQTALVSAANQGQVAMVQLLGEMGADLEAMDRFGRTALVLAASGGQETMVQVLLEKGAKLEAKDQYGRTALVSAAKGGHKEVVRLLAGKGADLEAKDEYGRTHLELIQESMRR